jgi:hypothetical protein
MMLKHFVLSAFCVIAVAASGLFSFGPAQARNVQAELTELSLAGGGTYRIERGAQVTVNEGIVVPSNVTFDLNGGELVAILTRGDVAGVRLLSNATLRNGTVTVLSRGSPGSQASSHAAVLIGALLGDNPSVNRISPFESPSGWVVSGITVRSDKRVALGDGVIGGAAGIHVMGGAHDGLIENITVPDSDVLFGGVMLDWGTVGAISSTDVLGSAAAYRSGSAYTTHPHDIVIRGIRVGRLTRPSILGTGSFGVRLSGVHEVTVSDVSAALVTEAGFYHTAGDLGYEFARPADRARAHLGIVVRGVRVDQVDGGYLVRTDSYADNIGRAAAQGYRPVLQAIAKTDISISDVSGAAGPRSPGYGVRIDHQRGGRFSDISARGFRRAFYVDEQVYDVSLVRPVAIDSLEAAISIEHPHRPPARVAVTSPRVAGGEANARTLIVGRSDDVHLTDTGDAHVRASEQARGLRRD